MNVRKVVAGSALAAGLGVAGLLGSATAFADVTNNTTTNDSNGYGVTNAIHNIIKPAGGHGVGEYRNGSDPNQAPANTTKDACGSACIDTQGSPTSPGVFGPISNAGGKK